MSNLKTLTDELAAMRARIEALTAQVAADEKANASGTGTHEPVSLLSQTKHATGLGLRSVRSLAQEFRAPLPKVATLVRELRAAGKLYETADAEPRYLWIHGDEQSPQDRAALVGTLISERPWKFVDLLAATGARRGLVSGAIVELQRVGRPVLNCGTERRARWFLVEGVDANRVKRRRMA